MYTVYTENPTAFLKKLFLTRKTFLFCYKAPIVPQLGSGKQWMKIVNYISSTTG